MVEIMSKTSKKEIKKKKAIYSRKSKYTGKGESIENQIDICKNYLKMLNPTLTDDDIVIFSDEGYTGANTHRPQFQKMAKEIENNEFDTIICYRLDRISRNVVDFVNLQKEWEKHQVEFISVNEKFDTTTPLGKAMLLISIAFANLERDTIAERIRDNMCSLAKTGRWLGGTTPLGFQSQEIEKISIDGKKKKLYKLSPVADEIGIVRLIFDKFLQLKSQTQLETYMIQNDIITRNNINFSRWGLKNILTNPVYCIADIDIYNYFRENNIEVFAEFEDFDGVRGIMAYNKTEQRHSGAKRNRDMNEWIVSVGKHNGIISGKEWIEVQNLLTANENKRYRKPTKNNSLLSGLLKCSKCGSYMRPKLKRTLTADGDLRFDYLCELKEKSKGVKCDCKTINGNEVDKLVMTKVKELVEPNSTFKKKLTLLAKGKFDGVNKDAVELKALEKALVKNKAEIDKLLERVPYIDIELLADLQDKIKNLRADNTEIEKRIAEIKLNDNGNISTQDEADIVLNILDTYFTTFDKLDLTERRALLKLLISSVEFDGENINVNLVGLRRGLALDTNTLSATLGENSKCAPHITELWNIFHATFLALEDIIQTKYSLPLMNYRRNLPKVNKQTGTGKKIKYNRRLQGLTQVELAQQVGSTRDVIMKIENQAKKGQNCYYNEQTVHKIVDILKMRDKFGKSNTYLRFLAEDGYKQIPPFRKKHKLTIQKFAEMMGVNKSSVIRWEQHKQTMSYGNWQKFERIKKRLR